MRKLLANILVLFAALATLGPIQGASAAKPPTHTTPAKKDPKEPTLHIVDHHAYFTKRGTHTLEVRMIDKGRATEGTLCLEGKTHICKKILDGSNPVFDGNWTENIDLDDQHPTHIQLWSREGSNAAGGADAGNYSGPATSVILRASNGLIVQVDVRRN